MPVGERHHRIGLLQLAPQQVERLARAGDVRDHEVEGARTGHQVGERLLDRARRVAERAQHEVGALGQPVALATADLGFDGTKAQRRVGLIARQVHKHERDLVAQVGLRALSAHAHRHHRLQRRRHAAVLLE